MKFTDGASFEEAIGGFSRNIVPGWLQPSAVRESVVDAPEVFIRLDDDTHLHFVVHRATNINDHYIPKLVDVHYKKGTYYSAEDFKPHDFHSRIYARFYNNMPPIYYVYVAIPNDPNIYFAKLRKYDEAAREARVREARAREARASDMDTEMSDSSTTSLLPAKRSHPTPETSHAGSRRKQF